MATDLMEMKIPSYLQEAFEESNDNSDLSDGVFGGFGVLSIKASKWRMKHSGNETVVLNDDGDPRLSINAVLVAAKKEVSKIYYAKQYEDGDDAAPDCYSMDGVTPAGDAPNPQCKTCAACKHNVFGSRVTDSGKKSKACADSRRVAVVPAMMRPTSAEEAVGALKNEAFGGPMLLRVPATSLKELKVLGDSLQGRGLNYYMVVTRLSFDPEASYPRVLFKAMRPLAPQEFAYIQELRGSDTIENILATHEHAPGPAQETAKEAEDDDAFGDMPNFTESAEAPPAASEPQPEQEKPKPKRTRRKAAAKGNGAAKPAKQEKVAQSTDPGESMADVAKKMETDGDGEEVNDFVEGFFEGTI